MHVLAGLRVTIRLVRSLFLYGEILSISVPQSLEKTHVVDQAE